MLIVRELIAGHDTFNDIARGLPGIPRSTLSDRLYRLERKGVLSKQRDKPHRHRYLLTDAGRDLKAVVEALGSWGARWAFGSPEDAELDPGLILWRMRNRLNTAALPERRVVIHFDFLIGSKGHFWFIIDQGQASVCVKDPGFEIDLLVSMKLQTLYEVWLGRRSFQSVRNKEEMIIEGAPSTEQEFGSWFLRSPMVPFVEQSLARS